MDNNEYLIARIGQIKIGVYCRDVENVYSDRIRLFRIFYQDGFLCGLTILNNSVLQVLDLRRRIGMEARAISEQVNLFTFNTGCEKRLAVIVDEIIGMTLVGSDCIRKNDKFLNNRKANIDLLFPMIAVLNDGSQQVKMKDNGLIYLLDATYLEKHEPVVIEDSGELELF